MYIYMKKELKRMLKDPALPPLVRIRAAELILILDGTLVKARGVRPATVMSDPVLEIPDPHVVVGNSKELERLMKEIEDADTKSDSR